MEKTKFRSTWKTLFNLLLLATIIMGGAYVFFAWYTYYSKTVTLVEKQEQIKATQKVVESKGTEENFIKLALARQIEAENNNIPWSEHIKSLIAIIQEISETDFVWSNVLKFTDLTVDSDQLVLKGEVTNLILLYHSVPDKNYLSLIDRFNSLDFIQKMEIKEYRKAGDVIQFALHADISLNNATK